MGQTVIHSVLLFDGHSTHPDSTVIFDTNSGLVTSVSKSGDGKSFFPPGATLIDGNGHTLLPGLIEAHMHCHGLHLPPGTDASSVLKSSLKSGVTTVCDMHSDPLSVNKLRKAAAEELEQAKRSGGTVSTSDLKSSLYGATIDGGWPKPIVLGHDPSEELKEYVSAWPEVTVENAADFVRSHKADGADYIKLMQENCCSLALPTGSIPSATLDLQAAVVQAGHAEGMLVVGHALSVDNTEILLQAGVDGLTHTFIDQPLPKSITDLYKKTGAFVIPTLVALSSLTNEEQGLREKFADIAHKKGIIDDFSKQNMLDVLGMKAPSARLDYAYETVKRLKKEGIDVVAGTDAVAGLKGTAIGPSMWMELEMYVEKCGMSVTEALNAATAVSARRFGFHDRGVVSEGKRADLVLVKGNVIDNLQNLWEGEGIVGIWKEGLKAA